MGNTNIVIGAAILIVLQLSNLVQAHDLKFCPSADCKAGVIHYRAVLELECKSCSEASEYLAVTKAKPDAETKVYKDGGCKGDVLTTIIGTGSYLSDTPSIFSTKWHKKHSESHGTTNAGANNGAGKNVGSQGAADGNGAGSQGATTGAGSQGATTGAGDPLGNRRL